MKIIFSIGVLVIGIWFFWLVLPSEQKKSGGIDNIQVFIQEIMREAAIPGMAVAKVKGGRACFSVSIWDG